MAIYFIRHGEKAISKDANAAFKYKDQPLTKTGFEQADMIAAFFDDINISYIYASEYLRVQQTAAALARSKKLNIVIDNRLNEIDNGFVGILSDEEISKKFPDFWKEFNEHKKDCRYPGGETGSEVIYRQKSILKDLSRLNGNVAAFCHDGFIRILASNILGMPVYNRYKFICDYGGITEVSIVDGEYKIQRFNQLAY
jgi:broad specificity phosphatase PhoE